MCSYFPGRLFLSVEQIPIFQETFFSATEQKIIFQDGLFVCRIGRTSNSSQFSRMVYLFVEQRPIFQEVTFKYHRTDIIADR